MKGVSCLLDAKMSCYESMLQMLERRLTLKMKAAIYSKTNPQNSHHVLLSNMCQDGCYQAWGGDDRGTPD